MFTSKNKFNKTYESAWHPVKKIIGFYSGEEKTKYYRVQWMPSWIPEENLVGCEKLIEHYFVKQNIINKDHKDSNVNKFNKTEIKLEEEEYDCWGYKRNSMDVKVHDDSNSSDNEPLIQKTLKYTNTGTTAQDNLNKHKDIHDVVLEKVGECQKKINCIIWPTTPSKPVIRAMMSTTSPTYAKSPMQSPINIQKTIKVESADNLPIGRKYCTRSYYRELRTSLRTNRSRHKTVLKKASDGVCKTYNTRSRAKLSPSTNAKRTGRGFAYVSQCVKKLPYGYSNTARKSTSPRPRNGKMIEKTSPTNYCETVGTAECNRDDSVPEERKLNTLCPLQRSSEVKHTQRMIRSNEGYSNYDDKNIVPTEQVNTMKQEVESPEYGHLLCPQLTTSVKKEREECSHTDDSIKKMSRMDEELGRYKVYNSFLKKSDYIKDETLFDDTVVTLKDSSSRTDNQLKNRTNISNSSSSDENEAEFVSAFECDVCEKMFQTSVLLHRHRFIHCEDRPFTFHKRKTGCRLRNGNKENYCLQKVEEESHSSQSECLTIHTHQLRPRRYAKGVR